MSTDTFDVTARKVHQATCVALLAVGFIVGMGIGPWLVALVGVILLVGRYWWPADIFRQFTWRVIEPAGILRRRDVQEDHDTRRLARVLGGAVLLISAVLLALGQVWAWVFVAAIAIMIALDAVFDFCVLCAITYRVARLRAQT
ncbi:MAG TPA: DUF4395 family protein [Chloroflexota bacterium]